MGFRRTKNIFPILFLALSNTALQGILFKELPDETEAAILLKNQDFSAVLSKAWAFVLPQHHPSDWAIDPFTFSVASSVFFVKNKGGGLHPCTDYSALNAKTIK